MREIRRIALLHDALARVSERSMSEVVSERCGFTQVFIQHESPRDYPRYLSYLKRMGKSCPVVLVSRKEKDLRFMHETPERFAVQNSVAVTLKLRPVHALFRWFIASF